MNKWQGWRKIRYESELDPDFASEIASIPGGDKLYSCIQCGTCSGMCPLSPYMDYTPRQIIAMIRAGFKGEVLSSYTTWLCASCYSCTVECPKEIKLTDIMYAAKRLAIRGKVYPKRFPTPVLAGEFFKAVEKYGRSSESWVLVNLFMKTNPLKVFKQMGLGLRLWSQGRLSPKREAIKRRDELKSILKVLEKEHMVKDKEEMITAGKEVV
ncbi:MAG: 4Fe-4S dicluster domain-containing protein [candidate division Zixibacteria bacterium]|nr:4Fe-4S dicluster domain-containing protein [candidate division Zixibacteria bacterium]MDD5426694.1 4Fe-4S dicluster domain-containing protein [candidate division Zixibacteria bacterium]